MNSVFNISLKYKALLQFSIRMNHYFSPIHQILEKMSNFESSVVKVSKKSVAVEVIGSGAHGAPTSVFVHSGEESYLFNCGEGSQRIFVEFKNKISKVQNVFVTYPSWKNCGGLLGTSLTVQSTSAEEFFVHGGSKIKSLFYASKKFVKLKKLQMSVKECLPGDKFIDKLISIKYVHLYENPSDNLNKNLSESKLNFDSPESSLNEKSKSSGFESDDNDLIQSEGFESDDNDLPKHEHQGRRKRKRSHSEAPKRTKDKCLDFALSFICTTPKVQGSLLIGKCLEMNVPKGPLLGKLKNGEDITLEDGTLIKSKEVMTPDIPGVVIIVVECPTEAYLDSLLKAPEFYRHQRNEIKPEEIASVVIHFTAPQVVKNPKYEEWINRFPKTTKHLYVNEDNKSLGLSSLYRQQYKLNMLLPDLFPLLKVPPYPALQDDCEVLNEGHSTITVEVPNENNDAFGCGISTVCFEYSYHMCNGNNHIRGESLTFLPLLTNYNYDYRLSRIFDQKYFVQEAVDSEGFTEGYDMFKNEMKLLEQEVTSKEPEYPKIVFLGTGSSQPHKRRNSSGILVFLNEDASLLLDCGEGTFSQVLRFFGKEKTDKILMNLVGIYISHMHVDHHMGLISILLERANILRTCLEVSENDSEASEGCSEAKEPNKLFLLIPGIIEPWLNTCHQIFGNFLTSTDIIHNSKLVSDTPSEQVTDFLKASDLKTFKTTRVPHCIDSYGVMLEHNNGLKITYSGDTKPSVDLVELGKNCDLLIHEATMEDGMLDHAQRKSHCTISQAIKIGKRMEAKYIILTHFSQRYSHIPYFKNELEENVAVAFDNLVVSPYQLPFLSKLKNFLKQLYAEEHSKLEEKTKLYETIKKRESTSLIDYISDLSSKKQKVVNQ